MKQTNDFERLYYEKCEELENFEQNFNKISEKFSDVLSKIQQYQLNLIEDSKRLKEFLIFILQCFNHKQYEHITCIVNYAKENQTFLDKQIFETPAADSFKAIEKKYFEKSSLPENILNPINDKIEQISNNNNKNIKKNDQKISGYFSTEENDDNNKEKNSNKNTKFDYQNLKFSKTVTEKIGLNNKGQSINNIHINKNDLIELDISNNSNNLRNKSPNLSSSVKLNFQNEKSKDFSYTDSMVWKKLLLLLNLFIFSLIVQKQK